MNAKKLEVVRRILENEAYLPESGLYRAVETQLLKLSLATLHGLNLLIVHKVIESNELDRKVQKILAK